MPVSADTLRLLMAKGLSGDDLLEIVAAIDADMERNSGGIPVDATAERRRAYDRERKRKFHRNSTGVPPEPLISPLSIEVDREKKEREEKREAPVRKPPPEKRGTRLPDDWMPDEDDAKFGASLGFTAAAYDREVIKFRNYWHAETGAHATKRDWKKTFHNWLLRGAERIAPAKDAYRPVVLQTSPAVFVQRGTAQWEAWTKFRGKEPVATYHQGREGQFMKTEWPPQETAA